MEWPQSVIESKFIESRFQCLALLFKNEISQDEHSELRLLRMNSFGYMFLIEKRYMNYTECLIIF